MQQAAIDAAQSVTAEAAENAAPLRDENGMLILDANGNAQQPDPSQLHVGLASIEVGTGAVLALYGGPDFVANSRNWATTPRYAASTYKVWGAIHQRCHENRSRPRNCHWPWKLEDTAVQNTEQH